MLYERGYLERVACSKIRVNRESMRASAGFLDWECKKCGYDNGKGSAFILMDGNCRRVRDGGIFHQFFLRRIERRGAL